MKMTLDKLKYYGVTAVAPFEDEKDGKQIGIQFDSLLSLIKFMQRFKKTYIEISMKEHIVIIKDEETQQMDYVK